MHAVRCAVPAVRCAVPADRLVVVATVTAAFANDPAWAFMLGAEYARLAGRFAGALFDSRVGGGNVWIADDGASVSMWEPPDRTHAAGGADDDAWRAFRTAAGADVLDRVAAYDAAVAAVATPAPHWYLGVLATRPGSGGAGLASAVLAPVVGLADASGLDCCLETSTKANRAFYERRGFVDATEVVLPGGPPTWWLRRPGPR